MKYKVKTFVNTDEDEEELELELSFDEEKDFINNNKIYLKRGRNYINRNSYDNKGQLSSSSNINNSTTVRKTITNDTIVPKTSYKKLLKFNEEMDEYDTLEKMIRSIRDKKNEKFMSKNRRLISEYLNGLNLKDKRFLINNPELLQNMMDDAVNKIEKQKQNYNNNKMLKNNNNINNKFKNDVSYNFSYEI